MITIIVTLVLNYCNGNPDPKVVQNLDKAGVPKYEFIYDLPSQKANHANAGLAYIGTTATNRTFVPFFETKRHPFPELPYWKRDGICPQECRSFLQELSQSFMGGETFEKSSALNEFEIQALSKAGRNAD